MPDYRGKKLTDTEAEVVRDFCIRFPARTGAFRTPGLDSVAAELGMKSKRGLSYFVNAEKGLGWDKWDRLLRMIRNESPAHFGALSAVCTSETAVEAMRSIGRPYSPRPARPGGEPRDAKHVPLPAPVREAIHRSEEGEPPNGESSGDAPSGDAPSGDAPSGDAPSGGERAFAE